MFYRKMVKISQIQKV